MKTFKTYLSFQSIFDFERIVFKVCNRSFALSLTLFSEVLFGEFAFDCKFALLGDKSVLSAGNFEYACRE